MNKNMELEDFGADTMTSDVINAIEPIKLSVRDTIFYVNEKTKAVGCKLYFDVKGPADVISVIKTFTDNSRYEVVAEARVNPEDTYNIEVGKKVARAKAESMAYRQLANILQRITYRLMTVLNSVDDFMYKTDAVIEHNNNYLATF